MNAELGERRNCTQPDRDEPGLVCGYPLPCPWHTIMIDENGIVHLAPETPAQAALIEKIINVAKVLRTQSGGK